MEQSLFLVTRQLEMTRGMRAACGVFAVLSVMSIRELTWVVSSVPNRNGAADHVWHAYVVNEHVAGRSLYVEKDREVMLHDALVVLEPLITPTP